MHTLGPGPPSSGPSSSHNSSLLAAFPPFLTPPTRPNTAPRANHPALQPPNRPTVSSTLVAPAWAHYLTAYPDPVFVDTILNIITHGANVGYQHDHARAQTSKNLSSALEHPAAVSADIAAQVAKGCTRGPFNQPPLPHFRSSPLGAVVRKRATKVRRIHHLSWPADTSVNDGIPDEEAVISYDMFQRAVDDLIASGTGSLMIKLDLEQAFRQIPVRPADWHLLGFTWLRKFYYDIVFGFGLRSAPYIFNLFAEALHWIITRHIPMRLRHYLDDFLGIFPPSSLFTQVTAAMDWIMELGRALGLRFQPEKTLSPVTCIEYLGLELDSIAMEARLPTPKLDILRDLLAEWSTRPVCTLLQLQELAGYLQFVSQVIPLSRAFMHHIFRFMTSFRTSRTRRRVPSALRRDLDWWQNVASSWNGICLLAPKRAEAHIFTDASGTKGIGGIFGSRWFSSRLPRRLRDRDIQYKELFAVLHALLCWGPDLSGKHVIFHVDNQAVVQALLNLSNRSTPVAELLRRFLNLTCHLDLSFSAIWLSSSQNALADSASRFQYAHLFDLAPYLNPQPSSRRLHFGGTSVSGTSAPKSLFTYGTASLPAPAPPTASDRNHSSPLLPSVASQTPTAPSCQPVSTPSWLGLPGSALESRPERSNLISPISDLSTLTPISPSQPQKPRLFSASSVASSATTEKPAANPNSQSPFPSSAISSVTFPPPSTSTFVRPAASLTPHSSAAGNLPQMGAPAEGMTL